MTYQTIYDLALVLIGQNGNPDATADYADRSPKLINLAASALSHYDTLLYGREHTVGEFRNESLGSTFPLSDELWEVCALMLGSMLIADAHRDFAALLDSNAKQLLAKLACEKVTVAPTVEVY